jgi:hypothetical protein
MALLSANIMQQEQKQRKLDKTRLCWRPLVSTSGNGLCKSRPWRSDPVIILNSLRPRFCYILRYCLTSLSVPLFFIYIPFDVPIFHSSLQFPLCQLSFIIHLFFLCLILFSFWFSDPFSSSLCSGSTTDVLPSSASSTTTLSCFNINFW